MELSLDGKYLAVACGIPENKIIIIDVEKKKIEEGKENCILLGDRKVKKIEFNPNNNRILSVMYENEI